LYCRHLTCPLIIINTLNFCAGWIERQGCVLDSAEMAYNPTPLGEAIVNYSLSGSISGGDDTVRARALRSVLGAGSVTAEVDFVNRYVTFSFFFRFFSSIRASNRDAVACISFFAAFARRSACARRMCALLFLSFLHQRTHKPYYLLYSHYRSNCSFSSQHSLVDSRWPDERAVLVKPRQPVPRYVVRVFL
jgi:hypothetical protein